MAWEAEDNNGLGEGWCVALLKVIANVYITQIQRSHKIIMKNYFRPEKISIKLGQLYYVFNTKLKRKHICCKTFQNRVYVLNLLGNLS